MKGTGDVVAGLVLFATPEVMTLAKVVCAGATGVVAPAGTEAGAVPGTRAAPPDADAPAVIVEKTT